MPNDTDTQTQSTTSSTPPTPAPPDKQEQSKAEEPSAVIAEATSDEHIAMQESGFRKVRGAWRR